MRHFSAAKLAYLTKSHNDWCTFHGIKGFKFPSNFPLKTVLPMRLLLASRNDSELQAALCMYYFCCKYKKFYLSLLDLFEFILQIKLLGLRIRILVMLRY